MYIFALVTFVTRNLPSTPEFNDLGTELKSFDSLSEISEGNHRTIVATTSFMRAQRVTECQLRERNRSRKYNTTTGTSSSESRL